VKGKHKVILFSQSSCLHTAMESL